MSHNLIPIMKPNLPTYDKIIPYLKQIDQNRWYSNFGPLVKEFETRIAKHLNIDPAMVLSMSNGTIALTNVLRAWTLQRGSFCIVPAWSFMATAASACAAELEPYFVDVDEKSWALEPETVKQQLQFVPGKVSAVIVTAPFGAPIQTQKWDQFTQETGIPVMIDGAAAFDSLCQIKEFKVSKTPIMISLHATKALGCGEGGLILSTDTRLIANTRAMSNFGFSESTDILVPGTNGKMSEYTAAVALAELDRWAEKRARWKQITDWYLEGLKDLPVQVWLDKNYIASTCNLRLRNGNGDEVVKKLVAHGIESRKWWRQGCHRYPAYGEYPRGRLQVTEELARSVIGLPFTLDTTKEEVDYICTTLGTVLEGGDRPSGENMIATYKETKRAAQ